MFELWWDSLIDELYPNQGWYAPDELTSDTNNISYECKPATYEANCLWQQIGW